MQPSSPSRAHAPHARAPGGVRVLGQVRKFRPKVVAIRDASRVAELKEAIRGVDPQPEILTGDQGAIDVAAHPDVDAVVTGIVGARAGACRNPTP